MLAAAVVPPPTAEEVTEYTAAVFSMMGLDGVSAANFTLDFQLSLRKVLAAEFAVHYHYITISDISRRLSVSGPASVGSVRFTVTVRTSPSKAVDVVSSLDTLKDSPDASEEFVARLNSQVSSDDVKSPAVSLSAVTSPSSATGLPPPLHIAADTPETRTRSTTGPTMQPSRTDTLTTTALVTPVRAPSIEFEEVAKARGTMDQNVMIGIVLSVFFTALSVSR